MGNGEVDVFVGIGGNLPCPRHGLPVHVMEAAVTVLPSVGIDVVRCSRWYRTAPVPPSGQPPFVNGVLQVETALSADSLLLALHAVEARFGRVRGEVNAARTLDLDLLAYGTAIIERPGGLQVPHPRLHLRTFVLLPLAEVAPGWRHPRLGRTAVEMLADLPAEVAEGQQAMPLGADAGRQAESSGGGASAATLSRHPVKT
jgi:2-amino-4-hydroxy-6-hydroxymethyldihydropteridine diphosphokinase